MEDREGTDDGACAYECHGGLLAIMGDGTDPQGFAKLKLQGIRLIHPVQVGLVPVNVCTVVSSQAHLLRQHPILCTEMGGHNSMGVRVSIRNRLG